MNLFNPAAQIIPNWFQQILKNSAKNYTRIIERLAYSMQSKTDVEELGKLIGAVYDAAYRKAINDYQKQFKKMGINIKFDIVTEEEDQLKSGE